MSFYCRPRRIASTDPENMAGGGRRGSRDSRHICDEEGERSLATSSRREGSPEWTRWAQARSSEEHGTAKVQIPTVPVFSLTSFSTTLSPVFFHLYDGHDLTVTTTGCPCPGILKINKWKGPSTQILSRKQLLFLGIFYMNGALSYCPATASDRKCGGGVFSYMWTFQM